VQESASPALPGQMHGRFADSSITGERSVGKAVQQRTVLRVDGSDRHQLLLYFTPPGGREFLFDRKTYIRRR
jgi:hypothetical protein